MLLQQYSNLFGQPVKIVIVLHVVHLVMTATNLCHPQQAVGDYVESLPIDKLIPVIFQVGKAQV